MLWSNERSSRDKVFFESEHQNIGSVTVNSIDSEVYSLNEKNNDSRKQYTKFISILNRIFFHRIKRTEVIVKNILLKKAFQNHFLDYLWLLTLKIPETIPIGIVLNK